MGSYAYLTAGIITARQAELMKNAFWPMLRQGYCIWIFRSGRIGAVYQRTF